MTHKNKKIKMLKCISSLIYPDKDDAFSVAIGSTVKSHLLLFLGSKSHLPCLPANCGGHLLAAILPPCGDNGQGIYALSAIRNDEEKQLNLRSAVGKPQGEPHADDQLQQPIVTSF